MPDIEASTEKMFKAAIAAGKVSQFILNPSDEEIAAAEGMTGYYEFTLIWEGCLDEQFNVLTDSRVMVAAIYFEHLREVYAAGPGDGDMYELGYTLYVDALDNEGNRVTGTDGDNPLMQFDWPM